MALRDHITNQNNFIFLGELAQASLSTPLSDRGTGALPCPFLQRKSVWPCYSRRPLPSWLECMHKEKKGREEGRSRWSGGREESRRKMEPFKKPEYISRVAEGERTNERDRISEQEPRLRLQPHLEPRHRKQRTNCRFDSSADLRYFISFCTVCVHGLTLTL